MTLDARSYLENSNVYSFFQWCVGAGNLRREFRDSLIRPYPDMRMLDVGCGPADILRYLPDSMHYVGVDGSEKYIARAREAHGDRGEFIHLQFESTGSPEQLNVEPFDLVASMGVLHHLDDHQAIEMLKWSKSMFSQDARFVSFDGCYVEGQSPIARYMLSKDRGEYVRTKEQYLEIASKVFSNVKATVAPNRLRFPYTHLFLECS